MLDGISSQRPASTPASAPRAAPAAAPARPAPAAPSTAPAASPDRFDPGSTAPAAPSSKQAAAQQEVTVSDQEVRDQREEVRTEGRDATQATQQQLTDRARQIESHQDDPHYRVEIEDQGDKTIYREQQISDDGRITRETYLEVGKDQPPEVMLDETRQEGDHWVQAHQQAEGGGDQFKTESYQINFRDYPGSPVEFPYGSYPPYDPGRISQTSTGFSSDGGDVAKHDQSIQFGDFGQVTGEKDAVAEFRERPGSDVDLPGNIDDVLDDGQPVIESRISITQMDPQTGDTQTIADEHHWSQGQVRVSERSGGGGPDSFLVEKQSADGTAKDSQLLVKGAQESVRTHTQLNPDGSVSETQELWDTNNDGVIGRPGDTEAKLLQRTSSTRTYDDQGRLATQHRETEDLRTGEKRVEDYSRKVENGIATYNSRQQVTDQDGHTTDTTVEERALVHSDGEQLLSTSIRSGDSLIQITEDSRGRHFTSTNQRTGEKVQGDVRPSADGQGIELTVNGKTLQLNADGSFKDRDQLKDFTPDEFSAIPFLATGARGVKGIADSLGQDADKVEENLASAVKDEAGEKLKAAGQGIGAALSAYSAFNDIRKGDYLQAALDAAKAGVQGTQFAGSLLDKFEATSKLGKALGVAGSAITIASGIYGVFKADNDFDRATSGLNIVEGGLGVALALSAASGPAAPFLFAGIVGIEILKLFIDHEKGEHVPPLAQGMAG
ncbi:MAG TPA: hypothetical protein VND93_12385 [Myxococcales bacterium]|nr:hypothetical protein [Myxococcales bacterium]